MAPPFDDEPEADDAGDDGGDEHAERGPLAPYRVQLLLAAPVVVDRLALLAALRERLGAVDPVDDEQASFGFVYRDHFAEYPEGPGPVAGLVTPLDDFDPARESHLDASLDQTWEWDEAREVVAGCRAALVVNDFGVVALDRDVRLRLFQELVAALVQQSPVLAIHWLPAQRVVDPRSFLAGFEEGLLSSGPVNVRLYRVDDGQPGEHLMDTRGLEPFGLPDVQCHFVGLEPAKMAAVLFGCADYLFEKGDVIGDDSAIPGIDPDEAWACHHEVSLIAPRRTVVDVDAGPHRPQGEPIPQT